MLIFISLYLYLIFCNSQIDRACLQISQRKVYLILISTIGLKKATDIWRWVWIYVYLVFHLMNILLISMFLINHLKFKAWIICLNDELTPTILHLLFIQYYSAVNSKVTVLLSKLFPYIYIYLTVYYTKFCVGSALKSRGGGSLYYWF